ncbi:MAG: hypothetical protein WDO70_08275 [Alphaproteobacteria bacterium]
MGSVCTYTGGGAAGINETSRLGGKALLVAAALASEDVPIGAVAVAAGGVRGGGNGEDGDGSGGGEP